MLRAAIESAVTVLVLIAAAWWYYNTQSMKADYEMAIIELNNNILTLAKSQAENKAQADERKGKFNVSKVDRIVQGDDPAPAVKLFTDDTNRMFMDIMVQQRQFAMRKDSPSMQRITPGLW